MKHYIKIPQENHLVAWIRFIEEARPRKQIGWFDTCEFDFRNVDFLQPYHLTSIACLIEEFKFFGAKRIQMKSKKSSSVAQFLKFTSFDKYWSWNFDRDFCLKSELINVLPIWQFRPERIDPFANITQNFYTNHSLKGKDLSPLRLTVVEALNNIHDHSKSNVGGFIFTQYYERQKELVISICDFGIGIPTKVNSFLGRTGKSKLDDNLALEKALEQGFSTQSTPNNRGYGLDTILSNVLAADGQIHILSNQAYYWCNIKGKKCKKGSDKIHLNFKGTYLGSGLKVVEEVKKPEFSDHKFSLWTNHTIRF